MKLTNAQLHALATLANHTIDVGMHYFDGIRETTLNSLSRRGLVTIVGVRRTAWDITNEGQRAVEDLIREGRLAREP